MVVLGTVTGVFGVRAFQEVVKITQGDKCGSLTQ